MGKYPKFREVVGRLQAVPHEATIASFLHGELPVKDRRELEALFNISVDFMDVAPLMEAIGMRLKWCQEQSIDRLPPTPEKPFSGDAVIDAWHLLAIMAKLMIALQRAGLSINADNFNLLDKALIEIGGLEEKVLARWEEIEGLDRRYRAGKISGKVLKDSLDALPEVE